MDAHLKDILPQVWSTLTQSAERYVKTVVNYTEDADDPVDSDGEKTSSFNYVMQFLRTPSCKVSFAGSKNNHN